MLLPTPISHHLGPRLRAPDVTYQTVLVENEERSLSRLRRLLSAFSDVVHVVAEASEGPAAVAAIRAHRPDLVFMDIELPGFDGLEVLERIETQPAVIFTTAFDQHALAAFRTHAVDYLLKPIESEAIARALAKLQAMGLGQRTFARAFDQLVTRLGNEYISRLACRVGDRTVLLEIGSVLYFQADHKYTSVHTASREYLIDTPLIELERKVDPKDFIRIHRSTLVNVASIAEIRRWHDGKLKVLLKDAAGTELVASRMYADNLRNL